jgi:dTDP-L-rhamnose 4-epimerase
VRVLVTGGAGFIGSHVVDQLVRHGHRVEVVDRLHPYAHDQRPDYLNPAARYHWLDLTDLPSMRAVAQDFDAVCHHAAMVGLGKSISDIDAYVVDDDLGTARLLRALHENDFGGRFVLASSMVVYGEGQYRCAAHGAARPAPRTPADLANGRYDPSCPHCSRPLIPEPVTEDTSIMPRSVYAATKLHQEQLCAAFGDERGLAVTALRYHNVYGSRMPADTPYAGVAAIFRSTLAAGRAPRVFEDGHQLRDFVHVRDVARATVDAVELPSPFHGPINIGSGSPRSVLELANALHEAIGGAAPAPTVTGDTRPGDVRHVFADTGRALATLGYRSSIAFDEGLAEFAIAPLRGAEPG